MEGAGEWGQFVEALSQRAKKSAPEVDAALEVDAGREVDAAKRGESSTNEPSSSSDEPARESLAEESSASESSCEDVSVGEGDFRGLDMQALKGSSKSLTNKIEKQLREAAVAAAENRKKQRKRRRLKTLIQANCHDSLPSMDSEHEAQLAAQALRGVIAYFANA